MRATTIAWSVAAVIGGSPCRGIAHEGPEHEIEELTERINHHGESPGLLVERAVEYRVLGNLGEATKDLERAGKLDPSSLDVQRELGQVVTEIGVSIVRPAEFVIFRVSQFVAAAK